MSAISGRERVLMTLNHEKPDRVPIDFGGSRITGISAIAYRNLLDYLGRNEKIKLYDIKQQLAIPSLEVADMMGSDVVHLTRLGPTTGMPFLRIDRWEEGAMTDGTSCLVPEGYKPIFKENGSVEIHRDGKIYARRPAGGLYFDVATVPLEDAETPEDIDAYQWPDLWSSREDTFIRNEVNRLYHGTDKAIFAGMPVFDCSFFELGQYMFGFENLLTNFFLKPDMMEHWLDRVLEHHLGTLEKFLAIAGPYITAIQMNDDLGAQDNLLIPPDTFRTFLKPRMAKWISYVRKKSNAKIFFHCDGAFADIIDDLIEIGVDILNPLQTSARGMEPEKIKKRYGNRLSFWGGGIDTQSTLPFGSIDDVRHEVESRIKILGTGGGYVFATIHNIQADVSPDKIVALFETARKSGIYPLT